jgi:hypothetical protein
MVIAAVDDAVRVAFDLDVTKMFSSSGTAKGSPTRRRGEQEEIGKLDGANAG